MADEPDKLFAAYKSKLDPTWVNQSLVKPMSTSGVVKTDDSERPYRIHLEDITQENHPWGDISAVYRTGENVKQQRRRESRFGDAALVLRHIIIKKNNEERVISQLEIQSNTLRSAFMDIAKGLVNINLHQDPIIIPSPYVEIYYCERRIQEALDVAMDKSLCDQLRLLQKFREDYMARTVNDLHALEPSGLITFDLLSFIFAPGHPVVLTNRYLSHFPTHWTALLHSCHFIQDGRDDKNLELELRLKYTGFNGTVFGSVNTTITLDRFIGTKNITELPVYPIKYHPDHHNLLESLKVRGLEYSRLCLGGAKAPVAQKIFGSHVHYSGPVWELPPHGSEKNSNPYRSGSSSHNRYMYPGPRQVVAESLQCPVYYTSGGELGLDMWEIESNLRLIFKRMQRWGAVLLFDEADTFMAQRSEDNIERNALVSILLRMLEYQSGILFLTTNRIDDFDTAFFSRIHVRLEFDKPGAPQRTLIWSYLAEKDGHAISQEEFAKLGNLPMDGRRIKNVLRVASLLCRSRDAAGKTTVDDVKKSLRISAGDPNDEGVEQAIQDFCG
ncbi:AAA family ATPase [Colletotrichum camelliae]|nr:AAA family ATPase [Colletotrichum camelliae]